jgi:hypothetical protein
VSGNPDTPAYKWLREIETYTEALDEALEIDDYGTIFKCTREIDKRLIWIEQGCLDFLLNIKGMEFEGDYPERKAAPPAKRKEESK